MGLRIHGAGFNNKIKRVQDHNPESPTVDSDQLSKCRPRGSVN